MGIINLLLFAWFLSWFGLDDMFIKAMNELFNKKVTNATYYFLFFIVGAIYDLYYLFFRNPDLMY